MTQVQQPGWLGRVGGLVISLTIAALAYYLRHVIVAVVTPLLVAIFFAYLINPWVCGLEARRVPRTLAIMAIYLVLAMTLFVAGTYFIPTILRELTKLASAVPAYAYQVSHWYWSIQGNIPEAVNRFVQNNVQHLELWAGQTTQSAIEAIVDSLGYVVYVVLIPIMAYYLLCDSESLQATFVEIIPKRYRRRVVSLLSDIHETLGCWVRGQVTVCILVGLLTTVGLWFIGMRDFALLLGVMAGASDFIPYFGPIIGGSPAVLLGLLRSPAMAFKAVLVILVVQQLENSVISPTVLGHELGLHPLSIILGLLAGGELGGLWGMILAVPTMAVTKVLLRHWIRSRSELTP